MKFIKKAIVITFGLIVVTCVFAYFYFDKKFTPEPNSLVVYGESEKIPILWHGSNHSKMAALLLPVQIDGIDINFFMQFDTGSPNTVFYKSALDTIQHIYRNSFVTVDSGKAQINLKLGEMKISSDKFRVLNVKRSWAPTDSTKIIGTIGTDLMEKRTTTLNFKEDFISFHLGKLDDVGSDFKFTKRRILIPLRINGEEIEVIYDSGTSAFEYITSKQIWDQIRIPEQQVDSSKGNSMGTILTAYTTKTKEKIGLQNRTITLSEVTYIEGYSTSQYLMMKLTGMGGMLGNKVFEGRTIILDCNSEKYIIE